MKEKMTDGTIVYLPSETTLADSNLQEEVKKIQKLQAPKTALVVSELDNGTYRFKVFVDGKYWYVKEREVFKLENDD